MKFLVDSPLGGLIKWLRFCGFDTAALPLHPAEAGSLPPVTPDTCIITRQEPLGSLGRQDILVLRAETPLAQLDEALERLKISRRQLSLLSRCSRCNDRLVPISRDQVQGLVPEHVFHYQKQFFECPRCHRLFWPGSHLANLTRTLLARIRDQGE